MKAFVLPEDVDFVAANKREFYIKFHNVVNPSYVFTKPVFAASLEEAMDKARDWPYTTNWEMVA